MNASNSEQDNETRREGEGESAWQSRVKRIRRDQTLETLEALGFDVMGDRTEIQKDILFLRKLRNASETAGSKLSIFAFGGLLSLVGALCVLAWQHFVGNK